MADGRVFDQGDVEVVKCRPSKAIAPQSSEPPVLRAGSSWDIDGNKKERSITGPLPEIVFSDVPAR